MTVMEPSGELLIPPSGDVPALAAACKMRILEREGIPMFVALHDARPGRELRVRDRLASAEGARLAPLFDHYADGMISSGKSAPSDEALVASPGANADPTGAAALIDILVVLSDQHLRARPEKPS